MDNTKISYLYTDASNYKKHNEVVVSGTITDDQIQKIMGSLNDYDKTEDMGYFIPRQIGLPEERFEEFNEDDHCWFSLTSDSFESTDDKTTDFIDITANELVAQFEAIGPIGWDDVTYAIVA